MYIIASDLHLGCGDELEDFLVWGNKPNGPAAQLRVRARLEMNERFAKFLAAKMAQASGAGLAPTLLLLGDIFDFWQAQRRGERPHHTLERILCAHIEVVGAIQDWLSAGGSVRLVIGAHDQPLVAPRAWELLCDTFPGINSFNGNRPMHSYSDKERGLYAEHGHQCDPAYRMRSRHNSNATCTAREIMRTLVNVLEPAVPLIDKANSISGMIRLAQSTLEAARLAESFQILSHVLRSASFLLNVLSPWLQGRAADWRLIEQREQHAQELALKRLLSRRRGPAHGARFLVTGHSHIAGRETIGEVEVLNPGTWKPLALLRDNTQPQIVQSLSYAQIIPDGLGGWEASVRGWADECRQTDANSR